MYFKFLIIDRLLAYKIIYATSDFFDRENPFEKLLELSEFYNGDERKRNGRRMAGLLECLIK